MEPAAVPMIVDTINQTGFPIAASIGLFWIVNKTLKSQQEVLREVKTAILNNTAAIAEISAKIGERNGV